MIFSRICASNSMRKIAKNIIGIKTTNMLAVTGTNPNKDWKKIAATINPIIMAQNRAVRKVFNGLQTLRSIKRPVKPFIMTQSVENSPSVNPTNCVMAVSIIRFNVIVNAAGSALRKTFHINMP